MAKAKKKAKKKVRRLPKVFNHVLYAYVRKENGDFARGHGANLFGSFSGYIDALISKDRGVKPRLGAWKAKGVVKRSSKKKSKKKVSK